MTRDRTELVLAVYPNARGFAFALFEGPGALVDWGICDVKVERRIDACLARVEGLLQRYRPDVLVHGTSGRSTRTELDRRLPELAEANAARAMSINRTDVRKAFSRNGKGTRQAIVSAIVLRLPQIASFDPGPRKIWNSEDRRMALFDAAALALTFFAGPY